MTGGVLDADVIVLWGDFLHMNVYLQQRVDVLRRRLGLSASQANPNVAARYLLLRGQDETTLARTITFGITLSLNGRRTIPANMAGTCRGSLAASDGHGFGIPIRRMWLRRSGIHQTAAKVWTPPCSCQHPPHRATPKRACRCSWDAPISSPSGWERLVVSWQPGSHCGLPGYPGARRLPFGP